jgi:hypothetical protein
LKDAIGLHAFFWLYKSLKSCSMACSNPSYSHSWHLRLLYCTIFSQYVHCSKCIKTYKITPSHALLQSKLFLEIPILLFWKDWTCFLMLIKVEIKTSSHFSLFRSSYSGISTSFLKEPFKSFTHLYKYHLIAHPLMIWYMISKLVRALQWAQLVTIDHQHMVSDV